MAIHRYTDGFFDFQCLVDGTKPFLQVPAHRRYKRGDTITITNTATGQEITRIIAEIEPYPLLEGFLTLGLIDPSSGLQTQYSLTNEDGRTSVFWLGTHHGLQIGQKVVFHDRESEWKVDSRWTSLRTEDVPEFGRIGLVKELVG